MFEHFRADPDCARRAHAVRREMCRSDAGMTMIELMLTLGVFVAAMVVIMGSVVGITTSSAVSGTRASVSTFAQSILEEMQRLDMDEILTYQVPFEADDQGRITVEGLGKVSVEITAHLGEEETFQVGVDDAAAVEDIPDPLEVSIEVRVSGTVPVTFRTATMFSGL